MTSPLRRHATWDDLVALPEHSVRKLLAGELQVSPRPPVPHAVSVAVYRLHAGFWVLLATHGGDETIRAARFEAAAVELSRLWGRI